MFQCYFTWINYTSSHSQWRCSGGIRRWLSSSVTVGFGSADILACSSCKALCPNSCHASVKLASVFKSLCFLWYSTTLSLRNSSRAVASSDLSWVVTVVGDAVNFGGLNLDLVKKEVLQVRGLGVDGTDVCSTLVLDLFSVFDLKGVRKRFFLSPWLLHSDRHRFYNLQMHILTY